MIVERKNGQIYNLNKAGIFTNEFQPESPEPRTEISEIPGVDGHLDFGTRYSGRKLNAHIYIAAIDADEFYLLRNEIFRIFDSKESFNLIHKNEPKKRWINCKYVSPFSIERKARTIGEFFIAFQSTSAYSHSIGSLLDPYTFDVELWQFGMNIPMVDFAYKHHTRTFSIWNLGDKVINPRHDMLQLFYKGASNNLKIQNISTGDTWQYNGSSAADDTIELDGVFSRKNGISIFNETNRKLITLNPGENKFILTGTSGNFEIGFDFRFLYL